MPWQKQETAGADYGEAIDWLQTPEVTGKFLGTREITTKFGDTKVHDFDIDGEKRGAWSKARLDSLLDGVPAGSKVRVQFKGKVRLKNGNTLNDFEVDVWQPDGVEAKTTEEDPGF